MWAVCLMLLAMGTASCSSSDDEPEVISEPEVQQAVKVDYYLTNEAGDRTNVFNYGEDIAFHFEIKNDSTQKFVLPSLLEILEDKGILKQIENGENLTQDFIKQFNVYTSDGQYVNRACDYVVLTVYSYKVSPGDMYQAVFCWQKLLSGTVDTDQLDMYWKEKQRDPLPAGSYYTLHELYHEDGTSTVYRVDFTVRDK